MLGHQDTLDTAAHGLDEARLKIEATRAALQAVLDAQDGEHAELRAVIARLERIAAEVERVEEVVKLPTPVG